MRRAARLLHVERQNIEIHPINGVERGCPRRARAPAACAPPRIDLLLFRPFIFTVTLREDDFGYIIPRNGPIQLSLFKVTLIDPIFLPSVVPLSKW
ncbi:hypothetical protein EVAR_24497_1 [Eumeta japonica]|uniref:Uncharacterized protein n=1 Tax=Eumeta variegata TaxID=151549 RepID=A0A4C1US65_EUMVA|nr:hypothetical protein EVAR_24497_1 [Eumeta japonica]